MNDNLPKKKTVSFSQFSNWFTCPFKWKLDYIDKLKTFEDNLIMSFGTAIHETIQHYLKTMFEQSEAVADALDLNQFFMESLVKVVQPKNIVYTKEEWDGFLEDGKYLLAEFKDPSNRIRFFPRDKWELLGIETEINETILNNVNLTAKLDLVLKEKQTGNIRIIDFKTSTNGWTNYTKEDFTKTSQLVLYKAVYSKKYNVPISKIDVEFFILKRKLYDASKTKYEQSRLQVFKPSAYQKDVIEVIEEFSKFVKSCFTDDGIHKVDGLYPKNPGKNKKNCKYCNYLKNKKCDGRAEPLE